MERLIKTQGDASDAAAVVAVVDTGITPELFANARLLPGINLSREGNAHDTSDRADHGTAVAATVLRFAPQAWLVPVKLVGRRGALRDPQALEAAFDWLLDRQRSLGIDIVCATFADSSHSVSDESYRGSRLQRQIAALREVGVATVAPAGNWYPARRRGNPQGMAWPAIIREVVSVGAAARRPDGLWLTQNTQRLHIGLGTGCSTTIFVEPGEPGETSGAAAVIAGCLAALRQSCTGSTVSALVQELLRFVQEARDENGLAWPAVEINGRV